MDATKTDQQKPEDIDVVKLLDQYHHPVLKTDKQSEPRHFLAAFFFSFFFGVFGVDRFYLGKIWTGLLKLVTFGGLGLWVIIDLSLIMSGAMRDRNGNRLIDTDIYKKLALKTMLIFIVTCIIVALLVGFAVYFMIFQMINNGLLENFLLGIQDGSLLMQ